MTTDEMAVYIGERLFGKTPDAIIIKWLSSPDGIHAVKQAMIELGYGWEGEYDHEFYSYAFYKEDHYHSSITICEPIETDAILKSVYVALKAEEDKENAID